MNRLTDRLQMIADEITTGETMADIGTDHGFLPLYLWEKGISPKVIMCDISMPSLSKAVEAARELNFDDRDAFRVGDGLKVLKRDEVDAVVIAGMGGLLIRDILSEDMDKTLSIKKYVFQPRNNSGALRYWLVSNGFNIVGDRLVREGKFICEVITALTSENCNSEESIPDEDSPVWELSAHIGREYGELFEEYASTKLLIESNKEKGILKGRDIDSAALKKVRENMDYYRKLLGE